MSISNPISKIRLNIELKNSPSLVFFNKWFRKALNGKHELNAYEKRNVKQIRTAKIIVVSLQYINLEN